MKNFYWNPIFVLGVPTHILYIFCFKDLDLDNLHELIMLSMKKHELLNENLRAIYRIYPYQLLFV